jgi:peptidoglycan/LPS O-acetylase OafA/YrhL
VKAFVSARLNGLDTLRAIAIAGVMLFHLRGVLPESFGVVGQFGWMGVDLFFVLSGYLIGSQLLKPYSRGERPSLRQFYRRRVYRILPAYLFVLCLYFVWPAWREAAGISPLWQFLTFTENLFVDYTMHQAFSHVWSLCVEEHFYLVLPVLVLAMMRRPSVGRTVVVVVLLVGLGVAIRGFVLVHMLQPLGADGASMAYIEKIYYPTYTRLDGLLMGVVLAVVRIFRPGWWAAAERRGHSLLAAGGVAVGAAMWLFKDRFSSVTDAAAWGTVVGFPLLALGLGLMVASSMSRNGWLSRVRVPGARLVAMLAFSLYLIHKEIVHLDQRYLASLTAERDGRAMLVYGVSCMVAAGMLYVGVERPFLMLRDRLGRRVVVEEMVGEPAL